LHKKQIHNDRLAILIALLGIFRYILIPRARKDHSPYRPTESRSSAWQYRYPAQIPKACRLSRVR